MAYPYPNYERRAFWRRMATMAALGLAAVGAYLGVKQFEPAADEFVTLDRSSTSGVTTTTQPAPLISTTSEPERTTATAATTTSIVASAGPTSPPSTTEPASTSTSSTTELPIFTPGTTSPEAGPAPVVAIFDVETITLAGAVPSQAAADRLTSLAHANSKTPATVINLLTIDPTVPGDVGVRVIELNSTRFPTGLPEITLEHAAELQRMVTFMNALPAVTVTVVGHADQHGTDADNLALSRARAQAVVQFMIDQGIEPDRLTAEAAGESDLLSLEDDEAALALNRRTEFVIDGALLDA
jgi:outer membrane protein OmpA-like peptidoglycan-associated protein